MSTHIETQRDNKVPVTAGRSAEQGRQPEHPLLFVDNRPAAISQRALQEVADNSPRVNQLNVFQRITDSRTSGVVVQFGKPKGANNGPAVKKEGGSGQQKADMAALDDLEDIFLIDAELTALEGAKGALGGNENKKIGEITAKLKDAHILLRSVQLPEDINLYRQVIAGYTTRLKKVAPQSSVNFDDVPEIDIDLNISAQDILAYRNDIRSTAAWGGLAEAEVVADLFGISTRIFRKDAHGQYQQIITIGAGNNRVHNLDLLHLGNHYVTIKLDGNNEAVKLIETVPDGNCLFEALYIVRKGRRPTPVERLLYLDNIRRHVARHLTDEAIEANLLAIITQGETGGLGPEVSKMVDDKVAYAKIKRYDDKELQAIKSGLDKDLGAEASSFDYGEKIGAYKALRAKDKDSEETIIALSELQVALDMAERVVRNRRWKVDAGKLTLPMEWFVFIRSNVKSEDLAEKGEELLDLARLVDSYNKAIVNPGNDFSHHFGALDDIEDAFKYIIIAESIQLVTKQLRDPLRIALFSFVTQDIRQVRMNLLAAFRVSEKNDYRVDAPLERTDLHPDFYGEGETLNQGQRNTVIPESLTTAEKTLVKSMDKDDNPLGKNEGVTAVALKQKYPKLFSNIKRAERRDAKDDLPHIKHDVEYFDNLGRPWDQKAPVSHSKESNPVSDWVKSIRKQLGKTFPKDGTGGKYNKSGKNETVDLPVGVVLDVSYLTQNDYLRLWAQLIKENVPLGDRIIEVNAPYSAKDLSLRADKRKLDGDSNTSMLDKARILKAPAENGIYQVSITTLGIQAQIDAIRKNPKTYLNTEHPVYRNHGNPLPNSGSYFIEYYVKDAAFPAGAEMRIVWDKPNDIFYITGTHYRFWMSPYETQTRNPFFKLV